MLDLVETVNVDPPRVARRPKAAFLDPGPPVALPAPAPVPADPTVSSMFRKSQLAKQGPRAEVCRPEVVATVPAVAVPVQPLQQPLAPDAAGHYNADDALAALFASDSDFEPTPPSHGARVAPSARLPSPQPHAMASPLARPYVVSECGDDSALHRTVPCVPDWDRYRCGAAPVDEGRDGAAHGVDVAHMPVRGPARKPVPAFALCAGPAVHIPSAAAPVPVPARTASLLRTAVSAAPAPQEPAGRQVDDDHVSNASFFDRLHADTVSRRPPARPAPVNTDAHGDAAAGTQPGAKRKFTVLDAFALAAEKSAVTGPLPDAVSTLAGRRPWAEGASDTLGPVQRRSVTGVVIAVVFGCVIVVVVVFAQVERLGCACGLHRSPACVWRRGECGCHWQGCGDGRRECQWLACCPLTSHPSRAPIPAVWHRAGVTVSGCVPRSPAVCVCEGSLGQCSWRVNKCWWCNVECVNACCTWARRQCTPRLS